MLRSNNTAMLSESGDHQLFDETVFSNVEFSIFSDVVLRGGSGGISALLLLQNT